MAKQRQQGEELAQPPATGQPGYQNPADHSWSLQMLMDVQKAVSKLEGRFEERTDAIQRDVTGLKSDISGLRADVKALPSKHDIRTVVGIYVALATLVLSVIFGLVHVLVPSGLNKGAPEPLKAESGAAPR